MIAVDTSALMTILLREAGFEDCIAALIESVEALISAGTLSETRIVAAQRSVGPQLAALLQRKKFSVIAVTEATSERIGQIYAKWGKGLHPAGLNFGDCFAYDVAKEHSCPLLFVGNDFSRTDIESVIQQAQSTRLHRPASALSAKASGQLQARSGWRRSRAGTSHPIR